MAGSLLERHLLPCPACPALRSLLRSLPIVTEHFLENGNVETLRQDMARQWKCVFLSVCVRELRTRCRREFLTLDAVPLCNSVPPVVHLGPKFIHSIRWFINVHHGSSSRPWPSASASGQGIRQGLSRRQILHRSSICIGAALRIGCLGISQLPTEGLYLKAKSCKAKSNDHKTLVCFL